MEPVEVKVKVLDDTARLPQKAHSGDAGYDVGIIGFCKIFMQEGTKEFRKIDVERYTIRHGERVACRSGLSVALPQGTFLSVYMRSGWAMFYGLYIPNTPCVIDENYRGEIITAVANGSNRPITIKVGDKLFQYILRHYDNVNWKEVNALPISDRGEGGFGSTGN